jgi:hypothetical protein
VAQRFEAGWYNSISANPLELLSPDPGIVLNVSMTIPPAMLLVSPSSGTCCYASRCLIPFSWPRGIAEGLAAAKC